MFGEAGVSGLSNTSSDVNKCAPRTEGVTPHDFADIRNKVFAAYRVL